jgi:hypothetical protein
VLTDVAALARSSALIGDDQVPYGATTRSLGWVFNGG